MAFYWITQSYILLCALFAVTVYPEEVSKTTSSNVSTNFSCRHRPMGFYADVETNCRVYHTCDDHGNKFSYRCPEETAFRQDALICDHIHLVDCRTIAYPSTQFQNENPDEGNTHTIPLIKSPIMSIDPLDNHRHSFSRFFRVIQQPDKIKSNKTQSGFVFSASLFLRDKIQNQTEQITDTCTTCNSNSKNRMTVPTSRSLAEQFGSWNSRNDKSVSPRQSLPLSSSETRAFARNKSAVYLDRSFEPIANSSLVKMIAQKSNQRSPALHERSSFLSYNSDYHPYSETLRSIQANAHTLGIKSTTEIPVHALTLSLKPLVPNELEYDPYYPKQPTSTEVYYTPSNRNKVNNARISNHAQPIIAHPDFFEIPSILPDLNTLEDLVDRRKFFYIPRANIKSMH
ncbi:uncharacterized protein [Anoplolepis gracilipes]|uniref:uncharacterized protein n=1 Tax=Anoplolepis gracilipes TaxID=354296 RepID=UPI003B9E333E